MRRPDVFSDLAERRPPGRTLIDRLLIGFLFLIPLIPRPTITGVLRLTGPALVLIVAYFYFIWLAARKGAPQARSGSVPTALIFMVSGIISLFVLRIVFASQWDELQYLASKALSLALILVIASWLSTGRADVETVFRALFNGFLALSAVVIFVSLTGIPVFGEVRLQREFLLPVKVFKTTGVPRSYGEQGIFATAALSYILVYRKNYGRLAFAALFLIAAAATLASQSRSVYLSALAVLAVFVILQSRLVSRLSPLVLLGAVLAPLAASLAFDLASAMPFFDRVIGEGVFRLNVVTRMAANKTALSLILHDPSTFLLGISHMEWGAFLYGAEGFEIGLHNHFFSSLVFLGLAGGMLNFLLFLIPLRRIVFSADSLSREFQVLALSSVGLIINLQFYEGFFSIITAVLLGVYWHASGGRRSAA